jgi:hypothetical protein
MNKNVLLLSVFLCNFLKGQINRYYDQISNYAQRAKSNRDWDCGMEEIGPYKTSAAVYYCSVGKSPYYRIWAAYGELFNTGCEFPKP